MPSNSHSEARAALANPESMDTGFSRPGKLRGSWFPGLPFGHPGMTILALVGLLLTLLSACADNGTASDNDKRPVFYGGVSGGHTGP